MSNKYKKLLSLFPTSPQFVGIVTYASHPNYKIQIIDGTGLLLCTSSVVYKEWDRVVVERTEIKRPSLNGEIVKIEV